jgi:hypothetical protein
MRTATFFLLAMSSTEARSLRRELTTYAPQPADNSPCTARSDMCPMAKCVTPPKENNCKLLETLIWHSASSTCCPKLCDFECDEDRAVHSIEAATASWMNAVKVANKPRLATSHFCADGILLGTVSQTLRKGAEEGGAIEQYFDFFARLPGIDVKDAGHTVDKVTKDVFVNNARVQWKYDSAPEPLVARMTFVYRHSDEYKENDGWCIFELHSSGLPELNAGLQAASPKPMA